MNPDYQLDYLDREILKRLNADARLSFTILAKDLKISNSLVHQRVRKLQDCGVLAGYKLRLDAKKMGFDSITYTGIVTKEARFAYSVAEELEQIPEVVECHWVSGKYALFIKIVARDNEDLRRILYEQIHRIEGVGSTDSFISFGLAFDKGLPLEMKVER
ncbi:MAG: Lrp/AsnC ligand binding domain-containing protein [Bacteroidota bacterium]